LQLFKLILLVLSLLFLSTQAVNADIGNITKHEGSVKVIRKGGDTLAAALSLVIKSFDDVRTGNGKVEITFKDGSTVKLTSQSKLVIDEFVFDPNPTKSKMAFSVVAGTARFVTGRMGLIDKKNIKVRTATATIGVRGTDFTTTVDEIGRSLVVLLPEADGTVGELVVESLADSVILSEPYQATLVVTAEAPPSIPVILEMSDQLMSNLLIDNSFDEVEEESEELEEMEDDLLDFDGLDTESIEETVDSEEDIKEVERVMDAIEELDKERKIKEKAGDNKIVGVVIKGTSSKGLDPVTKIHTTVTDNQIIFVRSVSNNTSLKLDRTGSYKIVFEDGEPITVIVGSGESSIRIKQGQ
jgi:hypothetical protein